MQGEGQEFESPRLHHPAGRPCRYRFDHLIRVLPQEATDQRIAGGRETRVPPRAGRTLQTGIVIGKREVFLIFDFAVLFE